ncbi:MAG: transporter, family, methylenomycin resistance protein [Acetobacteraceae bacterium]|nr:transporter, family, methylenomycin resistance protein [Acetobacteraceae bacterium]
MESKHIGITVFATSLAFVLVQLDVSIINIALADMGARLHTGRLGLQWVVDAYALAFASLLLSTGALGDRIGHRRMFILGFSLFIAASALCGLAPDIATLIAARVLQGAGAAALMPSSLALLSRACGDDAGLRAWGVGWWTAAGTVGLAAGPLLGGVLVDLLGWRSIFLVNVPIGLAGIWLACRFVAASPGITARTDWIGQILALVALLSLTASVIEAHAFGWSSLPIRAGLIMAIVSLAALVTQERRHRHPMLPLVFFRQRTFIGATLVGFVLNMVLYGSLFVLGLYFQQTRHWPAWLSGLAFLPLPVVLGIANVLASPVAARLGAAGTMATGLLLGACGTAALIDLGPESPYGEILAGLMLIPAGIGITVPVMTASLLGSVPHARAGVASGVLNAVRQAGGAIGVALFGGWSASGVFLMGTALLVAASITAGCLIRSAKPAQQPAGAGTVHNLSLSETKEMDSCIR